MPSRALIQLKRCWLLSVLVVLPEVCAVGSPDRAQARVGEPICINYYCSRRSSLAGIATKFTGNRVSSETSQETSVGMARPMAPFTMFGNRSTTCMDFVRNEGPQSRLCIKCCMLLVWMYTTSSASSRIYTSSYLKLCITQSKIY